MFFESSHSHQGQVDPLPHRSRFEPTVEVKKPEPSIAWFLLMMIFVTPMMFEFIESLGPVLQK